MPGLLSEQIHLGTSSPYVGRKLGDTKARTRTGASIVAVVRDDTVLASPGPDEDLMPDDVLVVIGTVEGIQALRDLLLSS